MMEQGGDSTQNPAIPSGEVTRVTAFLSFTLNVGQVAVDRKRTALQVNGRAGVKWSALQDASALRIFWVTVFRKLKLCACRCRPPAARSCRSRRSRGPPWEGKLGSVPGL